MNKLKKITGLACLSAAVFCSGCWFGSDDSDSAKAQSAPMDLKAEIKNASELIDWIKVRRNQTEIQRNDAFGKLKGRMVAFRGEVREVGKTAFGGRPFVSLKVGKLDMFENINIQFNFKDSQSSTLAALGKGATHVIRGRIKGSGDLEDDASCDNSEIVPEEKYREAADAVASGLGGERREARAGNDAADKPKSKSETAPLPVGDVKINMEEIRAAIRTWQKDRWNADLIARSKEANGKVCAADFKIEAKYRDLQPTFDLLADDYAVYVNVLDSFADAASAGEAVSMLMKAMSFDDMVKMAKDVGKAVDGAKSIKDKAGWKDTLPIGKDLITISAVSASMINASGILKSIFDQVMKK